MVHAVDTRLPSIMARTVVDPNTLVPTLMAAIVHVDNGRAGHAGKNTRATAPEWPRPLNPADGAGMSAKHAGESVSMTALHTSKPRGMQLVTKLDNAACHERR